MTSYLDVIVGGLPAEPLNNLFKGDPPYVVIRIDEKGHSPGYVAVSHNRTRCGALGRGQFIEHGWRFGSVLCGTKTGGEIALLD